MFVVFVVTTDLLLSFPPGRSSLHPCRGLRDLRLSSSTPWDPLLIRGCPWIRSHHCPSPRLFSSLASRTAGHGSHPFHSSLGIGLSLASYSRKSGGKDTERAIYGLQRTPNGQSGFDVPAAAGAASAAGSRSHLRDVSDPVTWVYCYLSFVVVLCPYSRTRELLAYGQIIIQLARSHGGTGWLAYDCRFRQQVAAGTPLSWTEINPLLLAATVLGSAPAPSGRNCLSWDHGRTDCALASLAPQSTEGRRAPVRQRPYSLPGEYCRRFNAGSCPNTSESCRFLHACSSCAKAGHPTSDCKEAKGKSKAPVV